MSDAKNVHKIIKKAILEMMLDDQLHIISFLTPVGLCPSHASPSLLLTSPFPVTINADDLQDRRQV